MSRSKLRGEQIEATKNPEFTWSIDGDVQLIEYEAGKTKSITYDGQGRVDKIDFTNNGIIYRKVFTYNLDDTVASIAETEIVI